MTFIYEGKNYNYEFKYDDYSHEFVYEKMAEIIYEQSGKETENIIFEKDTVNKIYQCKLDKKLKNALEIISKDMQEYKLWDKVCNQKFKSSNRKYGMM